jgi:hypothetical protein
MLWWLVVHTKKGIQDNSVQIGEHLYVFIATFVNMGILHLVLPKGDD